MSKDTVKTLTKNLDTSEPHSKEAQKEQGLSTKKAKGSESLIDKVKRTIMGIREENFIETEELFSEIMSELVQQKLQEQKKVVAAKIYTVVEEKGKSAEHISSGFLSVMPRKTHVHIGYTGNQGHTEKNVANEFDKLHGPGSFNKVKEHAKFNSMGGQKMDDPSYSYSIKVPRGKFFKSVGHDPETYASKMHDKSEEIMRNKIENGVVRDAKALGYYEGKKKSLKETKDNLFDSEARKKQAASMSAPWDGGDTKVSAHPNAKTKNVSKKLARDAMKAQIAKKK